MLGVPLCRTKPVGSPSQHHLAQDHGHWLNKNFWRSRNPFIKGFLAARGI
ncbi:MAG: hypothetical protein QG657_1859 [Acidobacteriota bacterium]|nr:hypothetical protein [Acidobacteriota bacterium]